MKVEINEKSSVSPLQLVDKRIMKSRETSKNRKMEIMSLFPLPVHLLYCRPHQLQNATLTQSSQPRFTDSTRIQTGEPVVTGLTVYAVVYCLSSGTMHAVGSVRLHVDRMFEKRTEWLRSA